MLDRRTFVAASSALAASFARLAPAERRGAPGPALSPDMPIPTAINLIPIGPDGAPDAGLYGWIGIEIFQRIAPGAFGSLLCAIA